VRLRQTPPLTVLKTHSACRRSIPVGPLLSSSVGVGIMIAHNPLHGSGQAGFPHPALALGEDAHAMRGIGMTDGRRWQPAIDEAPHAIPKHAAFVAAPRQRAMPEPSHLESKEKQRRSVHGHSVIADVSTHHRLQPLAQFRDGFMHAPLKLGFHLVQLRLQSFAYGLPQHPVNASTLLLRAAPHDSGPMWVAIPLSCDFCIHYTSPV
jgi:hypothetical protein